MRRHGVALRGSVWPHQWSRAWWNLSPLSTQDCLTTSGCLPFGCSFLHGSDCHQVTCHRKLRSTAMESQHYALRVHSKEGALYYTTHVLFGLYKCAVVFDDESLQGFRAPQTICIRGDCLLCLQCGMLVGAPGFSCRPAAILTPKFGPLLNSHIRPFAIWIFHRKRPREAKPLLCGYR